LCLQEVADFIGIYLNRIIFDYCFDYPIMFLTLAFRDIDLMSSSDAGRWCHQCQIAGKRTVNLPQWCLINHETGRNEGATRALRRVKYAEIFRAED
jgi:hypothetical protein